MQSTTCNARRISAKPAACQPVSTPERKRNLVWAVKAAFFLILAICVLAPAQRTATAQEALAPFAESAELVDTALILAVDTSESVDETRFRLQMDGIATALEDTGVINTILGGPRGAIALQLVSWADHSEIALPWTLIASKNDARAVAGRIRKLPRMGGEFTCMARMFRNMREVVLDEIPYQPLKTVIDVSGDGIDNCESAAATRNARDAVIEKGAVVNGLPIIVDPNELVGEGAYRAPGAGLVPLTPPNQRKRVTLEEWFKENVIGGFGAFSIPADGYGDFARAMRSKFLVEISVAPNELPRSKRRKKALHVYTEQAKPRPGMEIANR